MFTLLKTRDMTMRAHDAQSLIIYSARQCWYNQCQVKKGHIEHHVAYKLCYIHIDVFV